VNEFTMDDGRPVICRSSVILFFYYLKILCQLST